MDLKLLFVFRRITTIGMSKEPIQKYKAMLHKVFASKLSIHCHKNNTIMPMTEYSFLHCTFCCSTTIFYIIKYYMAAACMHGYKIMSETSIMLSNNVYTCSSQKKSTK